MDIICNSTNILKEELEKTIKNGSRVSIAAGCFSMYAYKELKNNLDNIDTFHFLYTKPTFIKERPTKEKREFYIPRLSREKSIYGTDFEVRLRNNRLNQKAIAKECVDWIKRKAQFKSNVNDNISFGVINVENNTDKHTYSPFNDFTTVGLGCENGNELMNLITHLDDPIHTEKYFNMFNEIWNDPNSLQDITADVIDSINVAYQENSPEFIYYVSLFNIFNEFLEDITSDFEANEATGFKETCIWNKLYDFQQEAVLAIINKLERYNGCILADSVGLGKTYTALAVIKYYQLRNKNILVLCPKKLNDNWVTFKANYITNPIKDDRLRYDVLFHTDLSRTNGESNGLSLDKIVWGNYDLVVIDESHNFRNGGAYSGETGDKENRYLKLLNKVIRNGVETKVLMLSATPVNNRFLDLKNQLALAYENDASKINNKLDTRLGIDEIFKNAQSVFNKWEILPIEERTTNKLQNMLDFDFFELLDSVTIARSRKHIQSYYDDSKVGKFPTRKPPISVSPPLTDLEDCIDYNYIFTSLNELQLDIYRPTKFVHNSKLNKYLIDANYSLNLDIDYLQNATNMQDGRECGIATIMAINLLKRLESSIHSFNLTLNKINDFITSTIINIENYSNNKDCSTLDVIGISDNSDLDLDDQNSNFFNGRKYKIDLADMDYISWLNSLKRDKKIFDDLIERVKVITPKHDSKLQELLSLVEHKINNPINDDNKKILIFSAFSDTTEYLYEHINTMVKKKFGLDTALITGKKCKSTLGSKYNDISNILPFFSPISKEKELIYPNIDNKIDVIIATDCISEGQNLQDCDYLINYDIHWNPVRIIQRFGRIDRIGSINSVIQLVNFWPDLDLDEYIKLRERVRTRMKISVMTSTGDDDPINIEENGDLEYRKKQLERLQTEVVDIEDMSSGVSIMDLGLSEFKQDLLSYYKNEPNIDKVPFGMHAVVEVSANIPKGVIYVLKNKDNTVNINNQNRLHPFYLVYINDFGKVYSNYLQPKKTLDIMKLLCKGKSKPLIDLCKEFNLETDDGRDMSKYSRLLEDTISSIIDVKNESDIDSLFSSGGTSALLTTITGLEEFELILFLVVK